MASLGSLDALVRAEVGPGCRVTRVVLDEDRVGPLDAAILRAQLEVSKPFVVYEVTGGPPRSFSLPGLDPAPVAWSTAETVMTTALARLLDTGSPARMNLERASAALCLRILGDFAADRGFTHVPQRLRALAHESGVNALIAAPTVQEAKQGSLTEMAMATSWFGLLHEAGHVYWTADESHRVLTDAELEAQVRAASAEFPPARDRKSLELRHLHQEICADVACVRWLWSVTKNFMPIWTGNDANPVRFVMAVAAAFSAFIIINLCGQVAADCTATGAIADLIATEADQIALRVGFHVRLTIAIDLATKLAVQDLGDRERAEGGLHVALSGLGRRFEDMLAGFEQARYHAYNDELEEARPEVLPVQPRRRLGRRLLPGWLRGS